jgi:SulP family sulfate permease
VAKSLASKRRQKIDANQELVALGAANIGASFTGGYPVTGGFSRSLVNFTAGAVTPLASIITAVLVGITVLVLTPLLYFLPKATLAAIIVVAVANLIDVKTIRETWAYNKTDAASLIVTFLAVLTIGVELGIVIGAGLSIALYLWRTSRPHMAEVGRVGDTEHFRNILRHEVQTHANILMIRVDESLYFANTAYLEDELLARVADHPEIDHLVLIMSAVNFIDASALETLETLAERLHDAGVTLHMAEVKGPVMDKLNLVNFEKKLGAGHVYLSTHEAVESLRLDIRVQVA